ncbi:Holliday junction resolvase RuvX [Pedobacter sp.]|nr:Holliday junction resolvase RuvX [Candidatus Saccharibacteria bacterium]
MKPIKFLALDVGERRIGVAAADSAIKLAYPLTTIAVDGTELDQLARLMRVEDTQYLVIGYPRNSHGEPTKQTEAVEAFVARLSVDTPISYQDESLTSVAAEKHLASRKKPYTKADIDAHAAAIILTDYMESHYV